MLIKFLFRLLRLVDKSAYICLTCHEIRRGYGVRWYSTTDGPGWVCSRACMTIGWAR